MFCLLEACVEKRKDRTRLYSLKDKCPKNILPEFRFDLLNGYHEWICRRDVIELDLNKHFAFLLLFGIRDTLYTRGPNFPCTKYGG